MSERACGASRLDRTIRGGIAVVLAAAAASAFPDLWIAIPAAAGAVLAAVGAITGWCPGDGAACRVEPESSTTDPVDVRH